MNTTATVDKAEVHYEEGYHKKRHENHYNEAYYNARAKIALTKFFGDTDINQRILDYGCGLGQNILYLPNAMGFDISAHGIEFCKSKGINATNNIDAVPAEGFDVVFTSHVLEHHPYPKQMIEEMKSKLKTGKKLLLVIPYERHGKAQFTLDLNQHLYCWNFQTINNLLLTCGFKIEGNKYVRGAGYYRLLPLAKISFGLYKFATNLASRLFGIKEIMVVASKV
jgi:SAM-dependent methyltransferase